MCPVTDASGKYRSEGIDDVIFPGVTQGDLFVAEHSDRQQVYEVRLTGLDPNTPIISQSGGFNEVAAGEPAAPGSSRRRC